LLQVALPGIFSPHEFYKGIYEDILINKDEYLSLYNLFSDELSRQTLDAVMGYRFTFDPLVLKDIIDWDLYGTIPLEKNEISVDAGAYTGDSIAIFKEHVKGSFSKIYGFEPDSKSFISLSNRFSGDENIVLHNSGLYSCTKDLLFSDSSDRSSKIQEFGVNKINVVKLDDVVAENERITFIKMNIEGAEMDALEGAKKTIINWGPKLAISAYHKASDLRNICKKIKEFNNRRK
jgi:FkbM family methyltransferase